MMNQSSSGDEPNVVDFPMSEFIDAGLLHWYNRTAFWSAGLMLTARRWLNEGEAYRTAIFPKIRTALDDEGVQTAMAKAMSLRFQPEQLDELAETFWQVFSTDLRGGTFDALVLREYDPPERIVSGLTPDEQADRRARAEAWFEGRRERLNEAPGEVTVQGNTWPEDREKLYDAIVERVTALGGGAEMVDLAWSIANEVSLVETDPEVEPVSEWPTPPVGTSDEADGGRDTSDDPA